MLFLAFIFKRGDGYGAHAVLRSLITLQVPRRNLYAPDKDTIYVYILIIYQSSGFVNGSKVKKLVERARKRLIRQIGQRSPMTDQKS